MKNLLVYALTFGWIWRSQKRRDEKEAHLAEALDMHGDTSFAARQATDAYSKVEFAARYGRYAPSPVRQYVKLLAQQGLPLSDLRILLANRMFVAQNGNVLLRTDINLLLDYCVGWAMVAVGCVLMPALLACIYKQCGSIPWLPSLGAMLWMGLGYFFLSLYTIYPYVIVRRYAALLPRLGV